MPTVVPIDDAILATSASWHAGHVSTSFVSEMQTVQMPLPHSRHLPIACWPGCRSQSTSLLPYSREPLAQAGQEFVLNIITLDAEVPAS